MRVCLYVVRVCVCVCLCACVFVCVCVCVCVLVIGLTYNLQVLQNFTPDRKVYSPGPVLWVPIVRRCSSSLFFRNNLKDMDELKPTILA